MLRDDQSYVVDHLFSEFQNYLIFQQDLDISQCVTRELAVYPLLLHVRT